MSAICQNRALCVVVSVWNKYTMARNSVADMVIEAFDVRDATGGTEGVAGGSVKVASRIGGAVGVGGTDSMGSSSGCDYSACGGTGGAGLGAATTGAK